jgi:hypothetical protein
MRADEVPFVLIPVVMTPIPGTVYQKNRLDPCCQRRCCHCLLCYFSVCPAHGVWPALLSSGTSHPLKLLRWWKRWHPACSWHFGPLCFRWWSRNHVWRNRRCPFYQQRGVWSPRVESGFARDGDRARSRVDSRAWRSRLHWWRHLLTMWSCRPGDRHDRTLGTRSITRSQRAVETCMIQERVTELLQFRRRLWVTGHGGKRTWRD